ncbi:MAG: polysaccharide deacetylase family protein, partial [Clostridiales bacterium]|nr:polysaccharide deacetylase family protein [Clostridiales bacterium]
MREIKTVKKLRLITDAAILLILLGLASAMPAGGGLWSGGLAGAAGAAGAAVNRAYYSGNPDKPYVSLMINVYTGGEFIAPMMDVFDGYGVKATFFIGGSFAKNYPDIIREIARRGHELANHGYHHKDAAGLSYKTNFDEIIMAERQIEAICGIKTKLFAPPSGSIGGEMFKAAEALGYRVIMWS